MKYDPFRDSMTVTPIELQRAANLLIYSLRNIRILAGVPLDRYKLEGPLQPVDHAMKGILDAAFALGINFGASWGNELDLRKEV